MLVFSQLEAELKITTTIPTVPGKGNSAIVKADDTA